MLIRYDGRTKFTKVMGGALVTSDGEAIEEDTSGFRSADHNIISVLEDELPV